MILVQHGRHHEPLQRRRAAEGEQVDHDRAVHAGGGDDQRVSLRFDPSQNAVAFLHDVFQPA